MGEKVCIRVLGNPLPFAVGESALSEESIANRGLSTDPQDRANVQIGTQLQGLQGKAVDVLHCYGDALTLTAPPAVLVPNPAFKRLEIEKLSGFVDPDEASAPLPSVTEEVTEDGDCSHSAAANDNNAIDEGENKQENKEDTLESAVDTGADDPAEDEMVDTEEDYVDVSNVEMLDATEATMDPSAMDEFIIRCVLLVMRYIVKDASLPVLVSTLWPIILRVPQAEIESSILLRKSTFRKVSNVFRHLERRGVIEMEDENGISSVTSIARTHVVWASAKLTAGEDSSAFRKRVSSETVSAHSSDSTGTGLGDSLFLSTVASAPANSNTIMGSGSLRSSVTKGSGSGLDKVNVIELYKPPRSFLRSLFINSQAQLAENIFKASEVRMLLTQYIVANKYESPDNKGFVIIPPSDDELYPVVVKLKIAKPVVPDVGSIPTVSEFSGSVLCKRIEDEEMLQFEKFSLDGQGSSGDAVAENDDATDGDACEMDTCEEAIMEIIEPVTESGPKSSVCGVKATPAPQVPKLHGGSASTSSSDPWKRSTSTPFKAISLPSRTVAVKNSSGGSGKSALSSSSQSQHRQPQQPRASAASVPVAVKHDLMLKREELLVAVLAGMTKYHGKEREGQFVICSGGIPKISIVVERRVGNAVSCDCC
jgi:hypothetical protein